MNAPTRPVFATCDLCDAFENDTTGSFRVLSPVFNDYGAIGKFWPGRDVALPGRQLAGT